jgi:hypothetical protein
MMPIPLQWPRKYVVGDQVGSWACWSSVLEAVMTYYGAAKHDKNDSGGSSSSPSSSSSSASHTADSITKAYDKAGGLAKQPGSASNLELAVAVTGYLAQYRKAGNDGFVPSVLTFEWMAREIDEGHPIVCVMKYKAQPVRHVVLVYGYQAPPVRNLYVADPAPSPTRRELWSLQDFCQNYRNKAFWYEAALTSHKVWSTTIDSVIERQNTVPQLFPV